MNLCFSPRCLVLYYVGTTVSKSIDFLRGYLFAPTTNHVGLEYIGVGGEISTPLKAIDLEAVVSNLLSVKRTKQFLKSFIQVQV